MSDESELQEAIAGLRKPKRKGGLFRNGKKSAAGNARLELAHRFASLAVASASEADVVETLGKIVEEFPADRLIGLSYARTLAEAGRLADAIAEYEERLQTTADDAVDLYEVALLHERSGRSDLAIDRLRRAVDSCVASGDLDAAVVAARRLIELEPESLERASDLVSILRAREPAMLADALEHLADVYQERGKIGQEGDACREVLTLQPDREDIKQRLLGIYTRILEVDPDDSDAWLGLACVDATLADQLRVILARQEESSLEAPAPRASKEPHQAYASRKAQELIDEGDMLGASLCLERATVADTNPRTHLKLAQCYQALHREDEAIRAALKALSFASFSEDIAASDAVLDWILAIRSDAAETATEVVLLNQRPESADILYEALLHRWDEALEAKAVGAAQDAG